MADQYATEAKVTQLFQWQAEALRSRCKNANSTSRRASDRSRPRLPAFQAGNFVYQAPTSGGKSLVAEILMLNQLLWAKQNVLFVLPYISVIQEKLAHLQAVWRPAPISVLGL